MNADGSKRKLWIAAIILGTAVSVAVAGWWLRPLYRQHKEQRSLRQAQEFFAKGDFRSGLLSLRQTLGLNPNNLKAVQLMADFATQTQSPAALTLWRRVVEISPTTENKSLLAAAALRLEQPPFPLATQTISELSAGGVTNLGFHLLASQLALKLNRGDDAEFHLAAAAASEPTNRMHQLNLATLRLQSRHDAIVASARQELSSLTVDVQWGAPALRALIADALLRTNASAAQTFSRQLLATTNAVFVDRLQDLNAASLADDPALPQRLQQIQTDSATNALQTAQTAMWMRNHQRATEALTWLAGMDPKLRNLPPIPLVEADCFVTAKDWAGLEARLNDQKWDDQDFFRLAYLARALREQGRSTIATANWDRAIGGTLARSERGGALAQLAFNWGWREEGIALLWQISKRTGSEEWPLQNLRRIYSAENDTAGLWRVHEQLFLRHPDSLPDKNNFVMLSLLLPRDRPRAIQLARELYTAGRTNGILTSTYAFALHLEGRSAEGLKLLQSLPEGELSRVEVVPYHALLLAACGDKEAARLLLRRVNKHTLLREEKVLLETIPD